MRSRYWHVIGRVSKQYAYDTGSLLYVHRQLNSSVHKHQDSMIAKSQFTKTYVGPSFSVTDSQCRAFEQEAVMIDNLDEAASM